MMKSDRKTYFDLVTLTFDLDLQTWPRYPSTWPTYQNVCLSGRIWERDRHTDRHTYSLTDDAITITPVADARWVLEGGKYRQGVHNGFFWGGGVSLLDSGVYNFYVCGPLHKFLLFYNKLLSVIHISSRNFWEMDLCSSSTLEQTARQLQQRVVNHLWGDKKLEGTTINDRGGWRKFSKWIYFFPRTPSV